MQPWPSSPGEEPDGLFQRNAKQPFRGKCQASFTQLELNKGSRSSSEDLDSLSYVSLLQGSRAHWFPKEHGSCTNRGPVKDPLPASSKPTTKRPPLRRRSCVCSFGEQLSLRSPCPLVRRILGRKAGGEFGMSMPSTKMMWRG